ncbi:sialidase family protein [Paenibacillus koleovorans]|uniref:sialidase family protein n=1 Tax=Paenibacillus koleovorans TaxID=121608 RepID=UPI0013E33A3E|nr:sialidase family protein [Paenibacillus koleovorans]
MITEKTLYVGHEPNHLVCEPFYRKAPNGEHFIVFQSGGRTEPSNSNVLFVIHSPDKGESWSEPHQIFSTQGKGTWCSEVFVDEDKITAFIYEVNEDDSFSELRSFRSYSYDNGYTWTEREAFGEFHERCNMRQRIILSNGNWVIPYCYTERVSTMEDEIQDEYSVLKRPRFRYFVRNFIYRCGVLISTDRGRSFQKYIVPADEHHKFLWEPNCIELSNGDVVMYMRNEFNGWIWQSISHDGGHTWSKAEQTQIPDAAVKMRLLKLQDGRILLFCHPNPTIKPDKAWLMENCRLLRHPIEIWISDHDLKTWDKKINIQNLTAQRNTDRIDAYNYPDGFVDELDKKIYIAVDLNRNELVMFVIPFEDTNKE